MPASIDPKIDAGTASKVGGIADSPFRPVILDHCCFAWNKLNDMSWKIMSIGTRD
jgi:hypothetical protein